MSSLTSISSIEESTKFAIIDAGKIAKDLKKSFKVKYKSRQQPVTDADISIDIFLRNHFKKITPEFGWVSEESKDDFSRFNSEFFWCLDPIDGTRSYINGNPEYTISLALIKQNTPVIGMILNPETEEFFTARKGLGALCNRKKIEVNQSKSCDEYIYAISSSEEKKLRSFKSINKNEILLMGSIAYKIALVAKGQIDIALSFTKKNDWDIAAANIILEEAGGITKSMSGGSIYFNTKEMKIDSILASNFSIISELVKKFKIRSNE